MLALVLATALAACAGGAGQQAAVDPRQSAPLSLTRPAERPASVLMAVDETALKRAIDNYTVNRQREPASYRIAGADLDGDGTAEALVLFDGRDWCAPSGCSLVIFKAADQGYRALFRTVRVKPPVVVGKEASGGWRHVYVMSGGSGGAPLRRVMLRFGERGYPANAELEPEVPGDAPVEGEVALDALAAPVVPGAQAARSP